VVGAFLWAIALWGVRIAVTGGVAGNGGVAVTGGVAKSRGGFASSAVDEGRALDIRRRCRPHLLRISITPGGARLVATLGSFKPNATDFQGQLVAPGLSAKGFHQP